MKNSMYSPQTPAFVPFGIILRVAWIFYYPAKLLSERDSSQVEMETGNQN